ncbi:phospholipase A(1) LCAT3-like [Curcuma longa]|uniref:phospholipase A(1) LCAT3-like n=1 Tax=Curcuma longa TaxID=136217 RepID=UPI003D9E741C
MVQLFLIGLSASTIASGFGKTISETKELSDYRPEDISLSLLRMISYNIGQLVECPSIYGLLPNPDFKLKNQPMIQVWRKLTEDNGVVKLEEYDSSTCISLFEEALKNNEVLRRRKKVH